MFSGKIEGVIDLARLPQMVEQDSQFSGNGNDGSLFGVLPTAFREPQAPATQIAIGAEWAQDILGGGNEQPTQVGIACLGDAQLGVTISGLIASRDEADGRTDLPASAEAVWVFKRKDESQGGERAHAADPAEQLGLRVALAAKRFNLLVVGLDLMGEGSDGVENRCQSGLKGLRDVRSDFVSEAICCARG